MTMAFVAVALERVVEEVRAEVHVGALLLRVTTLAIEPVGSPAACPGVLLGSG